MTVRHDIESATQQTGDRPWDCNSFPGATEPEQSPRRGVRALFRDSVTLLELQGRLFAHDFTRLRLSSGPALLLLVLGIVLALATGPILLLSLGYLIAFFTSIPVWGALLISATGIGLIPAIVMLLIGWRMLQQRAAVLNRSASELRRNIEWLKRQVSTS